MKLSEDEREVLFAEVAQALGQVRSPELKTAYGELLTAVAAGDVPDDLLEPLQTLLEVGLESGRIRKVHTAHGEMAAQRVYARTPWGRAVRETLEAVNDALTALAGQRLEEVQLSAAGPGAYTVTIGTDRGRVRFRLDRQGARLQSVEVGG